MFYRPSMHMSLNLLHVCIFPIPPPKAGYYMKFSLKKAKLIWIQSFPSVCLTKSKERSLLYYLPIAGERTDGFMPFSMTLSQSETAQSRIWTRVHESISHDYKRKATRAFSCNLLGEKKKRSLKFNVLGNR